MRTQRTLRRYVAVTGAFALAAAAFAATPTAIANARTRAADRTAGRTVAHGLNSPRLISVGRDGALYVAEAGLGGKGPCVTGGDGSTVCLGLTGSITRIRHGHQRRVLKHLPSLAGKGGANAIGPAQLVSVNRHRYAISMGAGIDLRARRQLHKRGHLLGTIATGRWGHRPSVYADIVKFEWRHNPDHSKAHDSDPTGLVRRHHGYALTDAGGNTLIRARAHGHIVRAAAVFPDRLVSLPPQMGGGKVPMQAVPTAVAWYHGAYYVSQLTGFPFPKGGARIYKVVPGHKPTVFASGFTNLTDLAWYHHRLYAVQLADDGLLAAGENLPIGSLVQVHKGRNRHIDTVAHFPAPYGVAFKNRRAYVTTCSVCPHGGGVSSVRMHR